MNQDYYDILMHLLVALAAGGLIGFERSLHGRPAGFRTHALVCVASSALMLVTMYQSHWYPEAFAGRVALDPTRMAQGIMTGIGFLGAGVIFKEGLTVRGLTTAASIWITAAIGVLIGIGFYFPVLIATVITLGTLSVFRWIEAKMPAENYVRLTLSFPRDDAMSESELRQFLADHDFRVAGMSYAATAASGWFEYQAVIHSRKPESARRLAESLRALRRIEGFSMEPAGD